MNEPSLIGIVLPLSIVGVIVVHTYRLHAQQRWLAFDPLNAFWAGVLICYVLQPMAWGDVLRSWHDAGVFEETLGWILLALGCVVLGYEVDLGRRLGHKVPAMPRRLPPARLASSGYLLTMLGMSGYCYLMASAGGPANWLAVSRGGTDWANVSAYVAQLQSLVPLGLVLLLLHVEIHRVSRWKRALVWGLPVIAGWWFMYLGTRSQMIHLAATSLAAYYLPLRKNPKWYLLAAGVVVLLVLVNFQGQYRGQFTNLSFNLDRIDMDDALDRSLPLNLGGGGKKRAGDVSRGAEFNCVMTIVELVPDQVDYNLGYGHLEVFTRPIPRAVWPTKIYPAMESVQGVLLKGGLAEKYVATSQRPLLMGPAFTFAGHWYYVGGPLALILAGFLTGVLLRLIRTIHDRVPDSEGDLLLFSQLFMIGFGEAATTPLNWLYSLPFTMGILFVILRACRSPVRRVFAPTYHRGYDAERARHGHAEIGPVAANRRN